MKFYMKFFKASLCIAFIFFQNLFSQNVSLLSARDSICDCWLQRDSTWSIAQFDGYGVGSVPGSPPEYRNDDWSTVAIPLSFNFCFFNDTMHEIYINNNGNISFNGPYSTFSSVPFPDTFAMISPFWADVDTRGTHSGIVYYKNTNEYLVVQWDHVGYFHSADDKLNTFQLIISNGNSSTLTENNNVGFCYKEMQWTTGGGSGGIGGFGGIPASVGINLGNGIDYLQIGFFDNPSFNYDGPHLQNDGVYALNNLNISFNTCIPFSNIPPLLFGEDFCDTIHLCLGDTFIYNGSFISSGQSSITVTNDLHGMSNVNFTTTPGNASPFELSFVCSTPGSNMIDIIATDNGTTPGITNYRLLFDIQNCNSNLNEIWTNQLSIQTILHDKLQIDFKNRVTIYITDYTGKIIYNKKNIFNIDINTSAWRNGIYFISIISDNKIISKKIIKL
jgi:hypothetical protein